MSENPTRQTQEEKMVTTSYLKALHPLQVFYTKSPSSTLSFMKFKTLIHTLIVSHVCRLLRALSKAKAILLEILKKNQPIHYLYSTKAAKMKKHRQRKIFFGSFRLHYNWCSSSSSSHVQPVAAPHLYYDSTWNSIITTDDHEYPFEDNNINIHESQLSGYLQWLEDQKDVHHEINANNNGDQEDGNEIDRLAGLFIASCHEKFRLEKQESYRRFQEMMARNM